MISTSQQTSLFRNGPDFTDIGSGKILGAKDGEQEALWVPMLNNASKGRELPEKQLVILGGTPDQQREFLESLNSESFHPHYGHDRRQSKKPPVSNRYALGYTYQDVLDADQEDMLARLSIYMLSNPAPAFAPLLRPLFTPKTVPNTLITILLDWSDPLRWPRQLRQWIRLLRSVISALDDATKVAMEEIMTAWKERRAGPNASSSVPGRGSVAASGSDPIQAPLVKLGPGEWEDGLGVPLSVVCLNAEKVERMEKEFGWQDDEFDFVLQWMRCVLLRHGASLIYTTTFDSSRAQILIQSSLGIHPLLKQEGAKHNVIDRDKILIPPSWDSWGKILALKEGFEVEATSEAWSNDIQSAPEDTAALAALKPSISGEDFPDDKTVSAVSFFETALSKPARGKSTYSPYSFHNAGAEVEITVPDTQNFLAQQASILEQLRAEDDRAGRRGRKGAPSPVGNAAAGDSSDETGTASTQMAEQIGPYQINVGGIQVDAEAVTRSLLEREASRASQVQSQAQSSTHSGSQTPRKEFPTLDGGKGQNAALAAYFADLTKKTKRGASGPLSPRGSPTPHTR